MSDRGDAPGFLSSQDWLDVVERFRLSPREAEIVKLILEDRTERDIAHRLAISAHTVHTYMERLYRKLSVRSRTQLVVCIFAALVSTRPSGV